MTEEMLSEEDTKRLYITRAIERAGWKDCEINMEFTAGRISVDSKGRAHRGDKLKADYFLNYEKHFPLAVVEAKAYDVDVHVGVQQAMEYAKRLDTPFAFACNGHDLIEIDMLTGVHRQLTIDEFPSRSDLWQRFLDESGLPEQDAQVYLYPYNMSDGKTPRYYQRAIINKTVGEVLKGKQRLLIVCATGTGKTYEAFQIIYRLWKSGAKKRILYLADRNALINQTVAQDFAPFGQSMMKFDNDAHDDAHSIYLGIYQQFITVRDGEVQRHYEQFPRDFFDLIIVDECHRGSANLDSQWHDILDYFSSATQIGMTAVRDGEVQRHYEQFPRDFFDLIIVDECHRGSANLDSQWHDILDYFSSATQIGMTATPKDDADPSHSNIAYFGEPIYTYSLKQGTEDGFLAPFIVDIPSIDVDQGWIPPEGMTDEDNIPIEEEEYTQKDYDKKIALTDRHRTIAAYITDFLAEHNMQYAKTIVFCETIQHAYEMTAALREANPELCAEDERYVTTIVADEKMNDTRLEEFTSARSKYPVITVTSKLMSTGVDAKTCKLIVLDRSVGSMTEFKQIIGRGTRVKERYKVDGVDESKMYFYIMDFRSNYVKFQDPKFDGDPLDVDVTEPPSGGNGKPRDGEGSTDGGDPNPGGPKNKRVARVHGVEVNISPNMRKWLLENGELVDKPLESYIRDRIRDSYSSLEEFTAQWFQCGDSYSSLEEFTAQWFQCDDRSDLTRELILADDWEEGFREECGYSVDDFDIICDFGFDVEPPMSRKERTEREPVEHFLAQGGFNNSQQEILRIFLDLYVRSGRESLQGSTAMKALSLPQFADAGFSAMQVVRMMGGKPVFLKTLSQLEDALYEEEQA